MRFQSLWNAVNYQKLTGIRKVLDLQAFKILHCFFRFSTKIIVCLRSAQKLYDINKQTYVNLNATFKCACNETYGSHRLFSCLCVQCYKDIKSDCNVDLMNNKSMKFCILRPTLDILNFNGNMRFFLFF